LLIFGGAFSTIISLTNDIYGILLGLLLTAVQYTILSFKISNKRSFRILMLAAIATYVGLKIDKNAYSALPVLASTLLYFVLSTVFNTERNILKKNALFIIAGATLAGFFALQVLRLNLNSVLKLLSAKVSLQDEFSLASHVGTEPITTVIGYNIEFLQSLFGRYVWSHSTYPAPISLSLLFSALFLIGFQFWKVYFSKDSQSHVPLASIFKTLCMIGQYLCLFFLIEAAASYGATTGAGAWSFLVPRFFYPGIACVFVPLLLAVQKIDEHPARVGYRLFTLSALFWSTINVLYFYPQFFLADAW
jgi:hypothetical protein